MGRSRSRVAGRGATAAAMLETAPPGRVNARRPWVQHVLALALIAVVLALLMPEIALHRQIFLAADYEAPSAFAAAGRRALAAGEYPLWNPYIFLGMPSFASLSFTPWVFPPAELLSALGRLPGSPPLLWLLVYFAAAAYGVFVLVRALGCSFWPALVAGILFMTTPHLVSMGVFGHGSKLASVAFLPWLLWAATRLRHAARRAGWTALVALLLGLQLLRGHPQIAFYGLLLLALYGLVEIASAWRARSERTAVWRFGAALAGAVAIGLALGAVLLLPVRGYAPESIRGRAAGGGASYEFATGWSQSPGEMATFFLPSAYGFGEGTYVGDMPFTNFPHYLGVVTLLGAIAAAVFLRGRFLVFVAVAFVFALATSFGKHMPLVYDLLYAHLPYFNKFRVPVMILVLCQLLAAVAAGLGLAALLGETPRSVPRRRALTAQALRRTLVVSVVGAVLLLLFGLGRGGWVAARVEASPRLPAAARAPFATTARELVRGDALRGCVLLVVATGLVWAWVRRRLPPDVAGACMVLVAGIDLGVVDRRMVRPEHTWPGMPARVGPRHTRTAADDTLARYLVDHNPDAPAPPRILPLGELFTSNTWMEQGVASVGGYHPAKPTRVQALLESGDLLTQPNVMDMLAVRYIVTPEPLAKAPPPAVSAANGVAYANPNALPRAWVLGRWRPAPSEACVPALAALDPHAEVLLEATPAPAPAADATGTARVVAFTANRVELEVQASAAALVVLSEAYHPYWRAQVNGRPTPVLAADCVLRAVAVPAGASRVVFTYVDPMLRAGLATSLAAAAAILALAGLAWWQQRRPSGAEASA